MDLPTVTEISNRLVTPYATATYDIRHPATGAVVYPESQSVNSSTAGSGVDIGTLSGQLSGEVANFFNLTSKGAHRLGASDFS